MAISIRKQVMMEQVEVKHEGETVELTLPGWFRAFGESEGLMDSEEEMVRVATEQGVLHGLLHAGLQQALIGIRAMARPAKGERISTPDGVIQAQARVNTYTPPVVSMPKSTSPRSMNTQDLLAALKAKGLSETDILAMLAGGTED